MTREAKKYAWISVALHSAFVLFIAATFWRGYQEQAGHPQTFQLWFVPAFVDWFAVAFLILIDYFRGNWVERIHNGHVGLITSYYAICFLIVGGLQWFCIVGFIANHFEQREPQ